tara:strand:+ start:485 stop:676 length:192 start_codon:yes stop_codon:yes gene_type:complete
MRLPKKLMSEPHATITMLATSSGTRLDLAGVVRRLRLDIAGSSHDSSPGPFTWYSWEPVINAV